MNLVTGATGIVGAHVVLALARQGKPVQAARRKGSSVEAIRQLFSMYGESLLFEKISWAEMDILDIFSIEEAMNGVDSVYHCAGFVSFRKSDRKKLFKVNEQGTKNVVNACLHLGIKSLCHVSSLATINNYEQRKTISESVFWKKSGKESAYAISKYNGEREVWRGIEEGLNAVIVNPGVVLSPGFWEQSSSRLFDTCHKGNLFYTPGSTAYVSAQDVARIMIELVEKEKFGERFILAESNYSFKEIFTRIQENFGKKPPVINAGRFILNAGLAVETVLKVFNREPTLTRALINSALNTQKYDGSKIRQVLDARLEPVPAVLDEICRLYLKHRDN